MIGRTRDRFQRKHNDTKDVRNYQSEKHKSRALPESIQDLQAAISKQKELHSSKPEGSLNLHSKSAIARATRIKTRNWEKQKSQEALPIQAQIRRFLNHWEGIAKPWLSISSYIISTAAALRRRRGTSFTGTARSEQ